MQRRNCLSLIGSVAVASLAGCSGGGGSDGSGSGDGDDGGGDGDDEGGDGGSTVTVDSGPAQSDTYRLSDLDPATTTVEFGTEFDISVTVGNRTDTEREASVQLLSDGINYSRSTTLPAGGSETVTFAAVTSTTLGEGTHTFTVGVGEISVEGLVTVERS